MIAEPAAGMQRRDWRQALREAVTRPEELLEMLGLESSRLGYPGGAGFRLRVPRGYVARMRHGDPDDPLLRQIWPAAAEDAGREGFVADPVSDLAFERAPGLLQKYAGRALLVAHGACAVHCRYCFRRHYPYAGHSAGGPALDAAIAALAADPGMTEVILSGGDPLLAEDAVLGALVRRVEALPQVRRLRIHSRLPVVLPERIDSGLCRLLSGSRLQAVVVLHANHANEIDGAVAGAAACLRAAGITLLNQSVLLRGVNDDPAALAALSEVLFGAGVLPYYLHALDPVQGAAHFAVSDDRARAIHAALRARLPGYLVPRLVREIPGADAKTPL
ncbi:MAG: EF-P beta-lysylation protein EpmB [Gammaproteobacteria bacterium]